MHSLQTHINSLLDRVQALVDRCWLVDERTELLRDFWRELEVVHWMRLWTTHLLVMLPHHWDHSFDQLIEVLDVLSVLWANGLLVAEVSCLAYCWNFGKSRVYVC